ncbi:hypothetical protein ACFQY4_24715 [Catellatospora bangladeshensis]|uniref:hypothetical protein n=1 Tax=Catellatospora bangladeshensis TaxID=310355 RepID=UPI00361CC435
MHEHRPALQIRAGVRPGLGGPAAQRLVRDQRDPVSGGGPAQAAAQGAPPSASVDSSGGRPASSAFSRSATTSAGMA